MSVYSDETIPQIEVFIDETQIFRSYSRYFMQQGEESLCLYIRLILIETFEFDYAFYHGAQPWIFIEFLRSESGVVFLTQ